MMRSLDSRTRFSHPSLMLHPSFMALTWPSEYPLVYAS